MCRAELERLFNRIWPSQIRKVASLSAQALSSILVGSLLTSYAPEAVLAHGGRYEAIYLLPYAFRPRSVGATLRWYALSALLSAAALVLMVLLRPLMEHSIFFLFLAAVSVSALYGGLGPGLTATVLSTIAAGLYFLPPEGASLSGTEMTLRLIIFLATGVIVSWLAGGRRRTDGRLRKRNEELERRVAQHKVLEEHLEHRASHDDLTDLCTRAAFYEHLGRALARARRRGSIVALLFIDLDDFKFVNDSLGHQQGDRVLREVSQRLKACLRDSEMAARIGGDEFAVVLEDIADAATAARVAERLQERLRVPFHVGGRHRMYTTSASIGIAVGAQERPQELVSAADLAAYEAKRGGKGRSALFDPQARGVEPN
jgi:diguanylate cyclase (GGDEF)-like protein